MKVIQLTNPEPLPHGIYAKDLVTHVRICNYQEEIYRPDQYIEKKGYFIIYLAKCFKFNGTYIEVPAWQGLTFKIEDENYDELSQIATTEKSFSDDVAEIIGQFLIDKGYVEGTLVD